MCGVKSTDCASFRAGLFSSRVFDNVVLGGARSCGVDLLGVCDIY